MLVDTESYYTILMKAYTKAYKSNGKKYMPIVINKKLSVIEKGEIIENFVLEDKTNITRSRYSESLENMINKVAIYDEKGKQVGEVSNKTYTEKYGIFQDAYTKEEGVNENTAAKKILQGIEKEAEIEAIGNISCISGYGIKIRDSLTGLSGVFWIDSDTHKWGNGVHTMSLGLTFKNLMDTQEDEEEKKPDNAEDDTEVYITAASKKYHSSKTCSGMTAAIKVVKKEAEKKGKEKCGKCWSR